MMHLKNIDSELTAPEKEGLKFKLRKFIIKEYETLLKLETDYGDMVKNDNMDFRMLGPVDKIEVLDK